jgi:myo-inositol 2-dehydrogenase / D-chiro-inositol 1-dehydrogenase
VARVRACLDVVKETGAKLMVGFNRRFDPHFRAVRKAIDEGAVGAVEMVNITSRDPGAPPVDYIRRSGGIFRDMTIHDFDMARWLLGEEPVEVFAWGAVLVDPRVRTEAGDIDTAMLLLRTASGRLCHIANSRRAVYGYDQRVEVFGSRGMAASENPLAHTAVVRTANGTSKSTLPYFFLERYIPSYLREWEAFVNAVQTGTEPPVSGRDARAPLVIGLAAWQSLREGRPVAL